MNVFPSFFHIMATTAVWARLRAVCAKECAPVPGDDPSNSTRRMKHRLRDERCDDKCLDKQEEFWVVQRHWHPRWTGVVLCCGCTLRLLLFCVCLVGVSLVVPENSKHRHVKTCHARQQTPAPEHACLVLIPHGQEAHVRLPPLMLQTPALQCTRGSRTTETLRLFHPPSRHRRLRSGAGLGQQLHEHPSRLPATMPEQPRAPDSNCNHQSGVDCKLHATERSGRPSAATSEDGRTGVWSQAT